MSKADDKLIKLALERFKRASEAVSNSRELQKADVRFALGSPDNGWQWNELDMLARKGPDGKGSRPCLTVNKIPLHLAQVTNDARQSPPAIKVRPVDDKADPKTAEIFNGVIRHIEANSDADVAYNTALEGAARSGEGFIRVVTDYADDQSFEQEIFIRRVKNPFTVYMDPDSQMPDGSDGKFWFIEDWLGKEEFKAAYPKAEEIDWDFPDSNVKMWYNDNKVRIAEYFYKEDYDAKLYLWADGTTSDEPRPVVIPGMEPEMPVNVRSVKATKICWCKLSPTEVLEKTEWAGKYFPIVRVPGNDDEIDGEKVISGIVRNAKDAQRMYNYWVSQEAEFLSLWTKAPYIAPLGAIEGFEDQWSTANIVNRSVLTYNHIGDDGQPIPMPTRVQPPVPPSGIIQAKIGAADDIKSATGQFDASLGQKSNETSGRAIMARQREGDTATYHYIDNLSKAVRQLGRILVDLIPKIYDTQRIARVLGEDGEVDTVQVDPSQPQAVVEQQSPDGSIKRIYNLGVGRYDVVSTVGPSFTTKRQESVQAMTEMVQGNPQLWTLMGDLMVRNMDFPGAEEMAKRLKAAVPPQILQASEDEGAEISPEQMQAAKMQMEQMQQYIGQLEQGMNGIAQENETLKAQHDLKAMEIQVKQKEVEVKGFEAQLKAAELDKPEADTSVADAQKADIERQKLQLEAAIEAERLDLEEKKLALEEMKIKLDYDLEQQKLALQNRQQQMTEDSDEGLIKGKEADEKENGMAQMIEALTKAMMAPRKVVRDKDGRVAGTQAGE
jgi:hypothetical protein